LHSLHPKKRKWDEKVSDHHISDVFHLSAGARGKEKEGYANRQAGTSNHE
jgi:hypothetical protein